MNSYLLIKWLHIVSSVILVGTGFGSAFYLFFVNRGKNIAAQVVVLKLVIRADLWFTTPAILIQPISGLILVRMANFDLTNGWLFWALVLYGFAGLCWLPVVWIQIRMYKLANAAYQNAQALPQEYERLVKVWEWLGYPAFISMLIIYWLMVNKPLGL